MQHDRISHIQPHKMCIRDRFFPGPGGLLGQLGGLLGRFPLDGVAGEQEAVYLEIVGVLLGDDRGDFRKQMLVGFDSPIQIFVQFFPTGKYFPILSGNCLLYTSTHFS